VTPGGRSAFALALIHGHEEIATLLRERGFLPDLHESALAIDWERFDELATVSPGLVNQNHPIGGTAMYAAAVGGAGSQMWKVYRYGCDPDARPGGETAWTPLRAALEFADLETAEMSAAAMLSNGADPHIAQPEGSSPLHVASARGSADIVELLQREFPQQCYSSRTAYDANGDGYRVPDLSAFAPLAREQLVAASHGKLDYLLEQGAPCSLPTAVMHGDLDRARTLLDEDPKRIQERGAHDFALLWYPIIGGSGIEAAELLIEYGAEVEDQHFLGTTALHYAALGGQTEMVAFLIEHGADVNRVGRKFGGQGVTPLQMAEARKQEAVAKLLRHRGATG